MAEPTTQAVVPEALTSGTRPGRLVSTGRRALRWLGVLPFAAYVVLGLAAPTIAIAVGAFKDNAGAATLGNVDTAIHGIYLLGLKNSVLLSLTSSIVSGTFGLLIAYSIHTAKRGLVLRRLVITASGVFANFGGVPLAFLFIATLSTTGVVTGWIEDVFNRFDIWNHGFTLYDIRGVFFVYPYFLVPLMVLVILPALEGLRPAWREAAENMGARTWQYWRYVAGPVLLPSFLGCLLLLFGASFSAYATAEALTGGTIALTPIQIGDLLNGNVLAGQENLGYALGLIMVVIIAIVMIVYAVLQRRVARWLR